MPEPLFEQLQQLQKEFRGHPPVHKWNPELSGDMDMVIRRDGRWVHEGTEIRRQPLVDLFASILKREGDEYFLITPVEKWRIRVEDTPFLATQVALGEEGGRRSLLFTTNTGEVVPLNGDHSWKLKPFGLPSQPVPYIEVRDNLWARVSREAFYQLAGWAEERGEQLWLESAGDTFLLGDL